MDLGLVLIKLMLGFGLAFNYPYEVVDCNDLRELFNPELVTCQDVKYHLYFKEDITKWYRYVRTDKEYQQDIWDCDDISRDVQNKLRKLYPGIAVAEYGGCNAEGCHSFLAIPTIEREVLYLLGNPEYWTLVTEIRFSGGDKWNRLK